MQFTNTILPTLFISTLALALPTANPDSQAIVDSNDIYARATPPKTSSKAPANNACKRGELNSRCFGSFHLECQGDGRTTVMGTLLHANAIPVDCNQIATCDKRGHIVFKGHAGIAVPAAGLNACHSICTCEAGP